MGNLDFLLPLFEIPRSACPSGLFMIQRLSEPCRQPAPCNSHPTLSSQPISSLQPSSLLRYHCTSVQMKVGVYIYLDLLICFFSFLLFCLHLHSPAFSLFLFLSLLIPVSCLLYWAGLKQACGASPLTHFKPQRLPNRLPVQKQNFSRESQVASPWDLALYPSSRLNSPEFGYTSSLQTTCIERKRRLPWERKDRVSADLLENPQRWAQLLTKISHFTTFHAPPEGTWSGSQSWVRPGFQNYQLNNWHHPTARQNQQPKWKKGKSPE